MALSPMMKQYLEIKEANKDCILFFRLGDFYEMFFEDAKIASEELDLALTGRNCGQKERAPMCGVPFHSADGYISKLVEKGYKIAICEQIEDPSESKGIVKREIVQIITPGTVTSGEALVESENNFLASVFVDKNDIGIAYCDITTGETSLRKFSLDFGDTGDEIINDLVRVSPKEIIINEEGKNILDLDKINIYLETFITLLSQRYYSKDATLSAVKRQYKIKSIGGIGLDETADVRAFGGLLLYINENQKKALENITIPKADTATGLMHLDKATIANLEITETVYEKRKKGSLLHILDKTHTAMGGRKIKKWLREPLNTPKDIKARLDCVEFFVENLMVLNNIKENLKSIYDFERITGRIAFGNANARDLLALNISLNSIPEIIYDLDVEQPLPPLLEDIIESMDPLSDISELIRDSIEDDPPLTLKEGGLIKPGYSNELDELKSSIKDSKQWIASLESTERERTGIKNLKVGYNKVFGYYLEITKSNYDKIPEEYIRKQTLANAERFITPKLKDVEAVVLNAENKINKLEYDLFLEIKDKIKTAISRIQKTSRAVAAVDVLASFAYVSQNSNYVKPEVDDGDIILIQNGRHPVIEQTLQDSVFVPNDVYIDRNDSSFLLITGPNMAGKSTYMRQVALIVLMTQAGCFVPCDKAKIGIVDKIFTRIGASDNLAAGQSTFFVEMSELAYILNNSTHRSLIILDEIGRGTSTYDGLSIAWAVCEHLSKEENKTRTLFASHYHELTVLEDNINGFKNLNVDVAEESGEVIFLHKIIEGKASQSYGIHVAKIAGVPFSLLERADEKLSELEDEEYRKRKKTKSESSIFDEL